MKLVTVSQMKAIEKEADANGLTYDQMMENAGQGLAEAIQDLPIEEGDREIFGLVGAGNNGGDTLVALSHLAANGWQVRAYLVKRKNDALVKRLKDVGGEITSLDDDENFASLTGFLQTASILLDGVFGTGIKLPLKEDVADVLAHALTILEEADEPPFVVAVDCPSGMDCDTGEAADECIPADLTVTMAAVKQGMLKLPAYELVGDLQVVDIGLPDDLESLGIFANRSCGRRNGRGIVAGASARFAQGNIRNRTDRRGIGQLYGSRFVIRSSGVPRRRGTGHAGCSVSASRRVIGSVP